MSSFGVLTTGFLQKTLEDILQDIQEEEKAAISASLNTLATSVLGQLNGVYADALAQLWEVASEIHSSQAIDTASGAQLDNLGSIVNAVRLPATKSQVTLTLNLDAGTVVPVGSIVSVGVNGARFVTTQEADNSAGAGPANFTVDAESFEFGPIQALSGNIDNIQTAVSGWSANAGITSGNPEAYVIAALETLDVVVDGAAVQTVTFAGTETTASAVAAAIQAQVTSPNVTAFDSGGFVRVESDTVGEGTSIQITGGTANGALGFSTTAITAMNLLDAILGRSLETDADFRVRIIDLLSGAGAATLDAIRTAVLEVSGVDGAFVFENVTNNPLHPPLENIPAHAIEVVISGVTADDLEVATAIFNSKCAGIETHGEAPNNVTENVTDSAGFPHVINFTRSTDEDVYIDATIRVDPAFFENDQEAKDTIAAALVLEGDKLAIGESAIYNRLKCVPFSINGVIDVLDFFLDNTAGPTGTFDLAPDDLRNRLVFDTSRVNITTVPGGF